MLDKGHKRSEWERTLENGFYSHLGIRPLNIDKFNFDVPVRGYDVSKLEINDINVTSLLKIP